MKKQTLEEVALSFLPNSEVDHDTDFIIGFEFGAKWQEEQAKEMEKEQMIKFAKMHVKTALKAVENEMILHASSVKHWYLPQNIK